MIFLKADTKSIGGRLKFLREYSGLSRKRFGNLFGSEESTVCQWEHGYFVPRLVKVMNISTYFGISLDCILCGRAVNDNVLEKQLCESGSPRVHAGAGRIINLYNALSDSDKDRLTGYLEALSQKNGAGFEEE
jgi:transcriptional regulator with XRE-family HTH domain